MTGRSHGGGKVDSSASVDRLIKAPTPQMLVAHPSAPTSCGNSDRSRHADEMYNMMTGKTSGGVTTAECGSRWGFFTTGSWYRSASGSGLQRAVVSLELEGKQQLSYRCQQCVICCIQLYVELANFAASSDFA